MCDAHIAFTWGLNRRREVVNEVDTEKEKAPISVTQKRTDLVLRFSIFEGPGKGPQMCGAAVCSALEKNRRMRLVFFLGK